MLTLVRRLVELHRGTVAVASEGPGRGATFTVRLPAIEAPQSNVTVSTSAAAAPERATILLIEDNEDAREALKQLLTLDGYTVHGAADGRAGVEAAARLNPDVALVDIGMPEMDGYEVARTLRKRHDHGMVLIALTGYGQPEDERRAREAGFDARVVKPVDLEKLKALISSTRSP